MVTPVAGALRIRPQEALRYVAPRYTSEERWSRHLRQLPPSNSLEVLQQDLPHCLLLALSSSARLQVLNEPKFVIGLSTRSAGGRDIAFHRPLRCRSGAEPLDRRRSDDDLRHMGGLALEFVCADQCMTEDDGLAGADPVDRNTAAHEKHLPWQTLSRDLNDGRSRSHERSGRTTEIRAQSSQLGRTSFRMADCQPGR